LARHLDEAGKTAEANKQTGRFLMKSKGLKRPASRVVVVALVPLAMLAVAAVALPGAQAEDRSRAPALPAGFSGMLNDYTPPPSVVNGVAVVTGGPYEMHGKWSLQLIEARGSATFTSEMTMETADFANTDAMNHDPTKLGPHTHHISVTDGVIHNDPNDPINWKTQCPVFKPVVTGGFVVTGTAYVTGNGGSPPFGNPSPVTLCILGGTASPTVTGPQSVVEFSNFTLTFGAGSKASTHFGMQAINGVIDRCERAWSNESSDCKLEIVN
jgi:hypothetical protein